MIYSTPCLFAAQASVDAAIRGLRQTGGLLPESGGGHSVNLEECLAVLHENLARRDRRADPES